MKIIDLLNKIANGEADRNNKYHFSSIDYCTINEFFARYILDEENLNLEIIEIPEEKKMPEKIETYKDRNNEIFLDDLCYKYMPIHKDSLSFNEQVIVDKLNEVIDYFKSKGDE